MRLEGIEFGVMCDFVEEELRPWRSEAVENINLEGRATPEATFTASIFGFQCISHISINMKCSRVFSGLLT